jgi:hypothetical protein
MSLMGWISIRVGEGEAGEMIKEPIMVPMSTVLTKPKIIALSTVVFLNGVSPHQSYGMIRSARSRSKRSKNAWSVRT